MSFTVAAIYQNGTLKVGSALAASRNQCVQVTVEQERAVAELTYGLIGCPGDLGPLCYPFLERIRLSALAADDPVAQAILDFMDQLVAR
jgi:hypothetical protein